MFKNKVNIRGMLVLIVFAIFAIACLTLVDSATAVAIDSDDGLNNEKINSVSEKSIEQQSSSLAVKNKTSKNGKELVKKTVKNTKDKVSKKVDKKDNKNLTKSIENANKTMPIANVNTVEVEEDSNNNSSDNENNTTVASSQKADPILNDIGIEFQVLGLILVSIFCIISFSSFILYLRS